MLGPGRCGEICATAPGLRRAAGGVPGGLEEFSVMPAPISVLLRTGTLRAATGSSAAPARGVRDAALAALWAAGAGLVAVGLPVLLVWAGDARSGSGAAAALRAAGQVWLLAHATPLAVPGGRLGLVPLGLLLLPAGLLVRAGGHAAREAGVRTLREAAVLTGTLAGLYASLAAVVALGCAGAQARPSPLAALGCAAGLAAVGGGAGVLRAAGLAAAPQRALPEALRRVLLPAAAAVLSLLGAGATLAGASLAASTGRATELAQATAPGAVGGLALFLLGLALMPNAVVWGASWWAGPGFAVGTGTAVGPFAVSLGPVPALPVLAALPDGGLHPAVGVLALLVPLIAGVVAGRLLLRRGGPRLADAVLCGLVAGLGLLALAELSGGPVGAERLMQVGPSAWRVGLATSAEVAAGAAAARWLPARWAGWVRTAPEGSAAARSSTRQPVPRSARTSGC